jgi:hypothetical protein
MGTFFSYSGFWYQAGSRTMHHPLFSSRSRNPDTLFRPWGYPGCPADCPRPSRIGVGTSRKESPDNSLRGWMGYPPPPRPTAIPATLWYKPGPVSASSGAGTNTRTRTGFQEIQKKGLSHRWWTPPPVAGRIRVRACSSAPRRGAGSLPRGHRYRLPRRASGCSGWQSRTGCSGCRPAQGG